MSMDQSPENKTSPYQIRFTPSDLKVCAKFAELRGFLSMSSWVRDLIAKDMKAHQGLAQKAKKA